MLPDPSCPACGPTHHRLTAKNPYTFGTGPTFLLGTHLPAWLTRPEVAEAGAPLFISHRRLMDTKTFKRAVVPWALDSGGFSEIAEYGRWRQHPIEYLRAVRRYSDEIGMLRWAAPMDWMCEPGMRAKTGRSVAEHQYLTCQNYCTLRALWADTPDVLIIPVLQGWTRDDYLRHVDMFMTTFSVDLDQLPLVGIGSVCRRQHTSEIHDLISLLSPYLRLHAFGVKTLGLALYGPHLVSADSMAWSAAGRRTPGPCGSPLHGNGRNEANCLPYALNWWNGISGALAHAHAAGQRDGAQLPLIDPAGEVFEQGARHQYERSIRRTAQIRRRDSLPTTR